MLFGEKGWMRLGGAYSKANTKIYMRYATSSYDYCPEVKCLRVFFVVEVRLRVLLSEDQRGGVLVGEVLVGKVQQG